MAQASEILGVEMLEIGASLIDGGNGGIVQRPRHTVSSTGQISEEN